MLSDENSIPSTPEQMQLGEATPHHQQSIPRTPATTCSELATDDTARHAFEYFRFQACANFRSAGYPGLWADRAIVAGLNEPSIFYAVAATGMAERALTKANILHTSLVRPIDSPEHKIALQLYSKALSYLRRPLQRAITDGGPLEPVILGCAVLLVFEARLDAHLDAMRHIRMGHRILNEGINQTNCISQQQLRSPSLTPQSNESWSSAAAENADLGFENTPVSSYLSSFEHVEASLESLIEAGQEIHAELHHLAQMELRSFIACLSGAKRFCIEQLFSRVVDIPNALQSQLNNVLKGLLDWGRNFRGFLMATKTVSEDLLFMQIRYFCISFKLALSRSLDERHTDCFVDEVVRTLDNVERLLLRPLKSRVRRKETVVGPVADDLVKRLGATNETPFASSDNDDDYSTTVPIGPPMLSESPTTQCAGIFQFGILPALFLIACKCRTSIHRRRALRLLQEVPRVEGVNSSSILYAYADAIVKLEEQQAVQLNDRLEFTTEFYADEVSAQARFLDVVASEARHSDDFFTLSCARLTGGHQKQIELLEYMCNPKTQERCLVSTQTIALDNI